MVDKEEGSSRSDRHRIISNGIFYSTGRVACVQVGWVVSCCEEIGGLFLSSTFFGVPR